MFDVNQITTTLRGMGDRALQQYAMMNKANPYVLSLAVAESNQRKQLRTAAQARNMAPQPKVADAAIAGIAEASPAVDAMGNVTGMAAGGLPENQGIGRLSAPNIQRMADGGIAGYGDDEEGMATGGMGGMFNFTQRSEPVIRMSGGGVPGYAGGVYNEERFKEFLKNTGKTSEFANASPKERQKILTEFADKTSGPQKAAAPAASTAPTSSVKAAATPEDPRLLRKISEKVGGGAAQVVKRAGPVGLAVQAGSNMGDYKIQSPEKIDTSLMGTLRDVGQGEFGRAAKGLGLGLAELGMDAGSFGANMLDYIVPGKAPVSTAYEKLLKRNIDDGYTLQGPSDKAPPQQATPPAAAPAAAPVPEAEAPKAAPDAGIKTLIPSSATTGGNFAPSKAPTTEDAAALGDKFFNSKARIGEINRQVLQEQMDAGRAKENSIEALAAFNKKQGPAYAGYEESLKKEELQDATDKEKAGLQALFKGFLAIAAGESPNAATNLAKGSMVGLEEYSGAMKEFKKAAKERNKEMQNIQQARRAEERGDFDKVQMYEDRANTANQAAARYGLAAINDITNAGGKASSEIYNTMATNTSRENIAKFEVGAANARAQTPDKMVFDALVRKNGGDTIRAAEELQKMKAEKFNMFEAYSKYLGAFANKEGVSPPMDFDQFAKKFIPEITPNKNTTVRTQPGG